MDDDDRLWWCMVLKYIDDNEMMVDESDGLLLWIMKDYDDVLDDDDEGWWCMVMIDNDGW